MNWLDFVKLVNNLDKPRILELGTKRVNPEVSTMRKDEFTSYSQYLGRSEERRVGKEWRARGSPEH